VGVFLLPLNRVYNNAPVFNNQAKPKATWVFFCFLHAQVSQGGTFRKQKYAEWKAKFNSGTAHPQRDSVDAAMLFSPRVHSCPQNTLWTNLNTLTFDFSRVRSEPTSSKHFVFSAPVTEAEWSDKRCEISPWWASEFSAGAAQEAWAACAGTGGCVCVWSACTTVCRSHVDRRGSGHPQ
jgi:hypothetical protein